MDTQAKIMEIFEKTALKLTSLQASINTQTNSYDFEKLFKEEMSILEQSLYQEMVGGEEHNKNERMKLSTSLGEISIKKSHPLAV
jgi:hypothetical protein